MCIGVFFFFAVFFVFFAAFLVAIRILPSSVRLARPEIRNCALLRLIRQAYSSKLPGTPFRDSHREA
jgi:hypothetical protein